MLLIASAATIAIVSGRSISSSKQIKYRYEVILRMKQILLETSFKRVLILKAENGGGVLHAGADLYASVIYEEMIDPFTSVMNKYHRVKIDHNYTEMLHDLVSRKSVTIITDQMPNSSLLRGLYEREGVAYSEVYYLTETSSVIYYISVATDEEGLRRILEPENDSSVRLYVSQIADILKKSMR